MKPGPSPDFALKIKYRSTRTNPDRAIAPTR